MHLLRKSHAYLFFRPNIKYNLFLESIRRKIYSEANIFTERFVQIQTCGNIYKMWKDQKLYSKLPVGDLTFKVPYIDTRPKDLENTCSVSPTVLALHGAPGSWRDFVLLSTCLHDHGCRVIAPSFPDFYTCKPGIFRHSDVEKAQYVRDFLTALSVSNVDFLVCHSGSAYPAVILCLDQKPTIKSLGLLNPVTSTVKGMKSVQPFFFLTNMVKASENPILLKVMQVTFPFILKYVVRIPLRSENLFDPLLSATTMVRGNTARCDEKYKLVSQKLPIFYAFGENDTLIPSKLSYDLAALFGASKSDIFIYDEEGHLEQEGSTKPKLKVLSLQKGSHYTFLKYPEIINKEIVDFLKVYKIL